MRIPKRAQTWAEAMRKSAKGRQVMVNLEKEDNVPGRVAKEFFDRVGRTYAPGTNPMRQMDGVLASLKSLALAGQEIELGLKLLTRFARLARLADLPALRKAGISLQKLARMPRLVDKIKQLPLGNRRGIVWAALNAPVAADAKAGSTVDRIVNRLGLTSDLRESMYQVTYNAAEVGGPCHIPTVMDAGADPRFRPAKTGQRHGTTRPRSGKGEGYPEYVHEKCTLEDFGITAHIIEGNE